MNQDGIDLLKSFEGCRLKAYIPVPGDVPTIGYGHTEGVSMGDTISTQKAVALLKSDILKYEDAVKNACSVTPNENQLAAMTCLAFNIGVGNFLKSTVLRAHNRGDEQAACRAFGLFNKASGKVLAGLTRRRAAEAALYLKPEPETQADHPMPQTVDAEKPLTKSPIGLMGAITSAGGVLGTISSVGGQANDAAQTVGGVVGSVSTARGWLSAVTESVGISPLLFCALLAIVVGGVVIYYRIRQRNAGMA